MEDHLVPATEDTYRLTFTGNASEYFRIWIVNIFLTIITGGMYYAWAKVRTRRYFYAHTLIAGHPFDYLADPRALLKGYLLVAGLFLLYVLGTQLEPTIAGLTLLAFYGLLPYLIYKSLRFRTQNSAYRNLRFHFHGTLEESYKIFLLWPLLIPLTLGLIFPYIAFQQRQFVFANFAYGSTRNRFGGQAGKFYAVYIAAFLGAGLAYLLSFLLRFGVLYSSDDATQPVVLGMLIVGYVLLFVAGLGLQQYIFAQLFNYSWNHSTLGPVRFHCDLQARTLVWIRFSNLIAIIGSLGLLIPWASVRRYRYILDHMTCITSGTLDDFTAEVGREVSAVGDIAADIFDLDLGL